MVFIYWRKYAKTATTTAYMATKWLPASVLFDEINPIHGSCSISEHVKCSNTICISSELNTPPYTKCVGISTVLFTQEAVPWLTNEATPRSNSFESSSEIPSSDSSVSVSSVSSVSCSKALPRDKRAIRLLLLRLRRRLVSVSTSVSSSVSVVSSAEKSEEENSSPHALNSNTNTNTADDEVHSYPLNAKVYSIPYVVLYVSEVATWKEKVMLLNTEWSPS
mmetsp:Transcript_9943/g.15949  ORF Transcript_9943/g.15949 Transcript_9943/m.15949 type:complete len:221 (-) Transcript_9943:478-1140(-)